MENMFKLHCIKYSEAVYAWEKQQVKMEFYKNLIKLIASGSMFSKKYDNDTVYVLYRS